MPRLILLNGPPGSGKSTLAGMYVDEHPLTLNLDIDRIRDLIGRWRDTPQTAGSLARGITIAAARTHLTAGHDVVVPQFLGRAPFIEDLEQLAHQVGADFHEVVLLDDKENSLRRFTERGRTTADPAHRDAHTMLCRAGGLDELSAMYDRLLSVIASRPATKVVPTTSGEIQQAYQSLLRSLS